MTGAYVVDIRTTKDREIDVTEYVTKYLTKGNAIDYTRQRFSRSRDFFVKTPPKPKEPATTQWWRYPKEAWAAVIERIANENALTCVKWETVYEISDREPGDECPDELTFRWQYEFAKSNVKPPEISQK